MQVKTPDEVFVDIPIEHMQVKDVLFVPTLKLHDTRVMLHRLAKECEIEIECHRRIHDGFLGVMVWRTK